jgi:hypothetical protein
MSSYEIVFVKNGIQRYIKDKVHQTSPPLCPTIDRFHLTSRRPYWCTKTMKWRPYWCTVRELALSYSNISYCFTTPLGPPITWVKTIYRVSQKKLTPLLFIWISNVSVFFDSPCIDDKQIWLCLVIPNSQLYITHMPNYHRSSILKHTVEQLR